MKLEPVSAKCPAAAIVIADGTFGPHIGIVYRCAKKKEARVLHLAWHYRLVDERPADSKILESPMIVEPDIDPEELKVLARLCTKRAAFSSQDIPYGFRYRASRFAERDGRFGVGPCELGLTCATFVLAMCDWALIKLLDVTTWRPRPEDGTFFGKIIALLEKQGATTEYLTRLRAETAGERIRAEEVAACSALSDRPVKFDEAKLAGERLASMYYEII